MIHHHQPWTQGFIQTPRGHQGSGSKGCILPVPYDLGREVLIPQLTKYSRIWSEGFWGSGIRQRDDASFPRPGFSPWVFRHGNRWFSPRASGNFPLFPLLRRWFPGFHGAEDEDDEDRRSLRLLRWCYPSLRAGATFGHCGFGGGDGKPRISKAWWLGQAFDGRPLTFCLFHDVRDVVHIVFCPKLGTPKSTMLVYFIFFHNKHDNLWVLSIFCTAPSITSSVSHALCSARWVWPAVSASPSSRWSVSWKKVDGQIEGVGGSIRCWWGRQDIQKKKESGSLGKLKYVHHKRCPVPFLFHWICVCPNFWSIHLGFSQSPRAIPWLRVWGVKNWMTPMTPIEANCSTWSCEMVKWCPVPGRNVLDLSDLRQVAGHVQKLEKLANKYIHGAGIMVFWTCGAVDSMAFPMAFHGTNSVFPHCLTRRFRPALQCPPQLRQTMDRGPGTVAVRCGRSREGLWISATKGHFSCHGARHLNKWFMMLYVVWVYLHISYIIYIYIYIYTYNNRIYIYILNYMCINDEHVWVDSLLALRKATMSIDLFLLG